MKIRAGGGALGQEGELWGRRGGFGAGVGSFGAGRGALGQQGAPPCYSSLLETLSEFQYQFSGMLSLKFPVTA